MIVHQKFTGNYLRNFTYLLEGQSEVLCVDPWDDKQVMEMLADIGKPLKAIINTHEHWDHIRGNQKLSAQTGCDIWAHHQAQDKIESINKLLYKGDIISLDKKSDYKIEVMDTPGHTFAHLCLKLIKDDNIIAVFTGDTLFNAGVGNCHNGGDPKVLYSTIKEQFSSLPDDTNLYPGHEYTENNLKFSLDREPKNKATKDLLLEVKKHDFSCTPLATTFKIERRINPFLRLDNHEIRSNINAVSSEDTFLKLRKLRDKW